MKNSFVILRIVAALLLIVAFGDHPYAYYQMLRWVVCGITGYGAFIAYENKNILWAWAFGITAVLFNPIMPFYLQRETWQLFDIAAALVLLISLGVFKPQKTSIL